MNWEVNFTFFDFHSDGISGLSRLTGTEHDQISRLLLGIIIDMRLPNNHSPSKLLCAVRGALDFLYLAQYPMHTSDTLDRLDEALQLFHDNKDIFIDLGVRAHFNIPKFHNIHHYRSYIEMYRTTDNFNTEYTERLHIDFAKDAYRATNFKDVYPQMSCWLERREKIVHHTNFIKWRLAQLEEPDQIPRPVGIPQIAPPRMLKMTKNPSKKAVHFTQLREAYGATFFTDALVRYLIGFTFPNLPRHQIEQRAQALALPFNTVPVFHKIKFTSLDLYTQTHPTEVIVDAIHVKPATKDKRN